MPREDKIQVVVEAVNKTKKELDAAKAGIQGVDDAAKQTSQGMAGLNGALTAVQAVLGIAIVQQAAAAVSELTNLGLAAERTELSFKNISGGASNAEQNLQAVITATKGMISNTDAMAASNRLMQMGLAKNSDELGNLTGMAVKLGTAMGREANASIEEFALLLANQSIPRLDTFGISAGKVRERIAELQKATPGLSRETAFMQAVMEQGSVAMERLGSTVAENALAVDQQRAAWENLRVELGQQFTQAAGTAAESTTGLMVALTNALAVANGLNEGATFMERIFNNVNVGMGLLSETMGGTSVVMEEYRARTEEANAANQLSAGYYADMAAMSANAGTNIMTLGNNSAAAAVMMEPLGEKAATLGASFANFDVSAEKLWTQIAATGKASGMTAGELGTLAEQMGVADSTQVQAVLAAEELIAAWDSGQISSGKLRDGVILLNEVNETGEGWWLKNVDAMLAAEGEYLSVSRETDKTKLASDTFNGVQETLNTTVYNTADAMIAARDGTLEQYNATTNLADYLPSAAEEIDKFSGHIGDLRNELDPAAESATDLRDAISQLKDKTITVTVKYVTQGQAPTGGGQSAVGAETLLMPQAPVTTPETSQVSNSSTVNMNVAINTTQGAGQVVRDLSFAKVLLGV